MGLAAVESVAGAGLEGGAGRSGGLLAGSGAPVGVARRSGDSTVTASGFNRLGGEVIGSISSGVHETPGGVILKPQSDMKAVLSGSSV